MTKENYQQWRFWPLICLAFLYLINVALINLATPLYFFKQGTEIVIIGFLVVGSTITYCFSPILLYKLSKKLIYPIRSHDNFIGSQEFLNSFHIY